MRATEERSRRGSPAAPGATAGDGGASERGGARSRRATAEWIEERCRAYRATGDRAVRNEVVEEHLHLADVFARRYANRGVPREDLRQIALLAMVRAMDRYDPDREASFATFASRAIDGEIKRWFRDRTWAVRPPRRAQELHLEVRRTADDLGQELGRHPTIPEIADHLDVSVDAVLEAMEVSAAHHAESTDATGGDDDELPTVPAAALATTGGFGAVDDRLAASDLLAALSERERTVLLLHFVEEMTQQEIADAIGVSQSYASRILRGALAKMQDAFDAELAMAGVA